MDRSDDSSSMDAEDVVLEGFRFSRERTNWLHRGSAMTTTDRLDIESIRHQVIDYQAALGHISAMFAMLIIAAKAQIDQGIAITNTKLKLVINSLSLSISWIACYIELLYLELEDQLYFVHRRRRFVANCNRSIDDMADDNVSDNLFGFKVIELRLLMLHWRIPRRMVVSECGFLGEEALLIFLHYIRTGTPFA
jgi:hypothetical protein